MSLLRSTSMPAARNSVASSSFQAPPPSNGCRGRHSCRREVRLPPRTGLRPETSLGFRHRTRVRTQHSVAHATDEHSLL
jgi:hypothetical protein